MLVPAAECEWAKKLVDGHKILHAFSPTTNTARPRDSRHNCALISLLAMLHVVGMARGGGVCVHVVKWCWLANLSAGFLNGPLAQRLGLRRPHGPRLCQLFRSMPLQICGGLSPLCPRMTELAPLLSVVLGFRHIRCLKGFHFTSHTTQRASTLPHHMSSTTLTPYKPHTTNKTANKQAKWGTSSAPFKPASRGFLSLKPQARFSMPSPSSWRVSGPFNKSGSPSPPPSRT